MSALERSTALTPKPATANDPQAVQCTSHHHNLFLQRLNSTLRERNTTYELKEQLDSSFTA